jgi:hypothetical protein
MKSGKNDGITVYIPKETILKEMPAKIKLSQYFFFDLVQELSDNTSQFQVMRIVVNKSIHQSKSHLQSHTFCT